MSAPPAKARGLAGAIAASYARTEGTIPGPAREVQMKTVHRKARAGRPPTGRDPPATTRMPATLMAEVEAWATANDATRSDAIRRLIGTGADGEGKANPAKRDTSQGTGCQQ